jgi:hypothetical protein
MNIVKAIQHAAAINAAAAKAPQPQAVAAGGGK